MCEDLIVNVRECLTAKEKNVESRLQEMLDNHKQDMFPQRFSVRANRASEPDVVVIELDSPEENLYLARTILCDVTWSQSVPKKNLNHGLMTLFAKISELVG